MTSVRGIRKGFFKEAVFDMGLKGYIEFIVDKSIKWNSTEEGGVNQKLQIIRGNTKSLVRM